MALPTRQIMINDRQRQALQKDVWSDKYVDAAMTTQGRKYCIKMRYRGGHTREYPKKSYEIVRRGKTFHYNAEYDDPSMIRNALSFRFFQWIGVPSPNTKHVLLKMNGENQGVYLEIEGVDRSFFRKRRLPMKSLIYAVNDNATFGLMSADTRKRKKSLFSGYRLIIGTAAERERLKSFIARINRLRQKQLQQYLKQRLDIENYLRWLAGAVLTGNYDGFDQNYALYTPRLRHKYRMIPWDYEGTWGRNCYGRRCGSDLVRVTGYNTLTEKVLAFKSNRTRYKEILKDILAHTFTVKKIMPVANRMLNDIAPSIYTDTTRKYPTSVFNGESDIIRNYIIERREIVYEAISKL